MYIGSMDILPASMKTIDPKFTITCQTQVAGPLSFSIDFPYTLHVLLCLLSLPSRTGINVLTSVGLFVCKQLVCELLWWKPFLNQIQG